MRDRRTKDGAYRKDLALLLDGGDIYQGNTMSNVLQGHSLSSAFMLMDYDAVALGNHEFDWGVENVVDPDGTMLDSMLTGTLEVNDIPVLTTNLYQKREKVTFAKEYIIAEKTALDDKGNELPVRIGVIGFTENYASSIMETRFSGAGFTVIVNYDHANQIAEELERSGQADATVLLTHGGADEAAESLGSGSVIDLVLGGHTHASLTGRTSWGLSYMQPAAYSTAYAQAEMTFTKAGDAAEFRKMEDLQTISTTEHVSKLYPSEANKDELDPAVVELTDRVISEISELLEARVGYIETSARKSDYLPGSGQRATSMGNWMASIIARAAGAEVGFVNSGGIRTDIVMTPENPWRRTITASDIYTMFPFRNKIYCYELTYEEFLTLMKYALTESGSSLLSRMTGIECYYVGETVQALVRDGKAVYMDGQWAPGWAQQKIRVGVSEFVATSNRQAGSMSNPLVAWSKTSRLISSDLVDVEGAFQVLDQESIENNWALTIDRTPYFVSGSFHGEMWEKAEETTAAPTEAPTEAPSGATAEPTEPAETTEREPFPEDPGMPVPVLILIIVSGVLLAAAAAVLIVMLVKRRKKKELKEVEEEL